MKSKAPLVMMEQMVMILVFALAAALCLQAFVLSDSLSEKDEARDVAVVLCENAAESLRVSAREEAVLYYGLDGSESQEPAGLRLEISGLPEDQPYLCRARVRAVLEDSGEELYSLEYAWQEVA